MCSEAQRLAESPTTVDVYDSNDSFTAHQYGVLSYAERCTIGLAVVNLYALVLQSVRRWYCHKYDIRAHNRALCISYGSIAR